MFRKYASAKVTRVYDHLRRTAGKKISGFDYEPRADGDYLYVAVRACTADVPNFNYDMLPSRELGEPGNAYESFIGAYNYLNHDNQDPAKARGAVIDAVYHDEDPDDKWVECLIEMDRSSLYRKLNNSQKMTISEATRIKEALDLTSEEASAIFFG